MPSSHIAYGLELQASFPLPGMRPGSDPRLPSLTVERVSPSELSAAWSGSSETPAWTGQLGDGCLLRIERGADGDVLFSYGARARFRLASRGRRLECAPAQAGLHWQQTLLSRVLPNVAILRGYEALHASAVEAPRGVVAIAGPSGIGKSTLAIELARRGWPLFTDDVLILGDGEAGTRAHPGTPHAKLEHERTVAEVAGDLPLRCLGVLAGERWIALRESAVEPRGVRLICLLEGAAEHEPAESVPIASTPLPLGPHMLGLPGEGAGRERERFAIYADLMSTAALVRLGRGSKTSPSELADSIERALARSTDAIEARPLVAGGAR